MHSRIRWFIGRMRTIHPKSIRVVEDHLVVRTALRSWHIELAEIAQIEAYPMLSPVDEVGIVITTNRDFFFTDADPWFDNVCNKLELDRHFGEGWHRRVEDGQCMSVSFK